ncbi:hypothetical protein PG987_002558 [Apiospora arundinis]
MFKRLFSREGGDSKGLGQNENESPGQRDAANVPNVDDVLTEAFPSLEDPSPDQGIILPSKAGADADAAAAASAAAAVDDGACIKRASSNPSTPPPSSPIL